MLPDGHRPFAEGCILHPAEAHQELCQCVERQVELQHVDMRLADDAEKAALDMRRDQGLAAHVSERSRALATRGTWNRRPPA